MRPLSRPCVTGLLPAASFTQLLDSVRFDPAQFQPLAAQLFREMNTGTAGRISVVLRHAHRLPITDH